MKGFFKSKLVFTIMAVVLLAGAIGVPLAGNITHAHAQAPWLPASAQGNPNPQVAPINSQQYGMTYGQWNARWWQWSFSVPASKNPALATNGALDCSVGQSGNVWFLAGQFLSAGTFTRSCTIPAGKALFIPLINSWEDNVCFNGAPNPPPFTVEQLRAMAANLVALTLICKLFESQLDVAALATHDAGAHKKEGARRRPVS